MPDPPLRECRYSIDSRDRIRRVGADWNLFAETNRAHQLAHPGAVLGRRLWDFFAGASVRQLNQLLGEQVRREQRGVVVPIRCDSPDRRRFMELRIEPAPEGGLDFCARVVREEPRPAVALLDLRYRRSDELLRICSWCKRVLLDDELVEVEEAVRRLGLFGRRELPDLTHTICGPCDEVLERKAAKSGPGY